MASEAYLCVRKDGIWWKKTLQCQKQRKVDSKRTGCQCRITFKTYPDRDEVLGFYNQNHDHPIGGCYDFNTLAPKQALTLSDITLLFLPLPTITLSYLSIYFCSYIFLSSRSSPMSPYITLSLHFTSDHSASDNLSRGRSIQIAYPSSVPTLSSLPFIPLQR